MRVCSLLLVLLVSLVHTHAQSTAFWQSIPLNAQPREGRHIVPVRALGYQLDTASMRAHLSQVEQGTVRDLAGASALVELPLPNGEFLGFHFLETPLMHPDLGGQYPFIRTYTGVAVDDPRVRVKFDLTPAGFHAMISGLPSGDAFVDPVLLGNAEHYQAYWKRDLQAPAEGSGMTCTYDEVNNVAHEVAETAQLIEQLGDARAGDCQLRTYRLALACTGEYANFFGATGANKAPAIAAMVTTMNRVNGIYERDATLTMVLVAGNDQLVFTNPATDGYTNNDGGDMLDENQTKCDAIIGSANYDIGHVFSTGGGGVAYLNSPCTSYKAGGVTGSGAPVGDPFDIDYVAHEMGHQFGANHSQNNNCNRAGQAAVEVGSGISIMGYAGICAPNVGSNSIAMLGGYSMQEIHANITAGNSSSCPQTVPLVNAPPTVSAGADYTIPRGTPFVLTAIGADPNGGDALTYSWEQMDPQSSTQPPSANSTNGPNFRPWLPSTDPQRWFPMLSTVLSGNSPSPNWEVLSNVSRTFNFRVTVRDNASGAGCNAQDNMVVTVAGSTGPFVVTQPNTAVTWTAGSSRTVTWNVAGTTGSPVNCALVDVLLSIDGGLTWPYTLASGIANNGTASIALPHVATASARIMVRGNGNIFYDVSNQDFTIEMTTPDFSLEVVADPVTACAPANGVWTVEVGSILGFSDPVLLQTSGLPAGLSAAFSVNPVAPGNSTTLTLSGTGNVALGSHPFTLQGTAGPVSHNLGLTLEVGGTPAQVSLAAPANGATVDAGSPLTWTPQAGAQTYAVEIASDPTMNSLVESAASIAGNSFTPVVATVPGTAYYWRVRGMSPCGNGAWSVVRSFITSACMPVTVRIILDRYGTETTWAVKDAADMVMASGGPYSNGPSNGTYPQPDVDICLPPGCYTLEVNDTYGDGICCLYGNGAISVRDISGNVLATVSSFGSQGTAAFCIEEVAVTLNAKVLLEGPYVAGTGAMRDDLRLLGLLPTVEPYTALGFDQVGDGGGEACSPAVLAVTGAEAIVDWIRVELRSPAAPATVVATRQALLKRNGTIVDVDGTSPVSFEVPAGSYQVAVRHRNHLGCMTASPITLSGTAASVDFSSAATAVYGTEARKVAGGARLLWMGNTNTDGELAYTGSANDRDPIILRIGGIPTGAMQGYFTEDVNMDGSVLYTGNENDRDPLLLNIGGVMPTQVRSEQLP